MSGGMDVFLSECCNLPVKADQIEVTAMLITMLASIAALVAALEPVINFAPVNPMESARLSQSDWDSGGNSECIPCHISRAPRFTRVLSIRATHAAPQS
jgi:hypothetical protein